VAGGYQHVFVRHAGARGDSIGGVETDDRAALVLLEEAEVVHHLAIRIHRDDVFASHCGLYYVLYSPAR
jgi:hypothetical protein